jgi:hypothetical protein
VLSGAGGDLEPRAANPWRLHDAFRYVQGNEITPARWVLVFAGKFATDTVGGRTSPALRATRPISSVLGAAGKGPGRAPFVRSHALSDVWRMQVGGASLGEPDDSVGDCLLRYAGRCGVHQRNP